MTWAFKRQLIYISALILFFGAILFFTITPKLNKAPSCEDKKQNGTETGIDCGGSCTKACQSEVDPISILWSRSFRVIPGRYNAVAYLENHNQNTAVNKINYRFRFADANNLYIGKREGSTYVPPSGKFAVFEPGIDVGNSVPVYTSFEFTQAPDWKIVSKEKIDQLKVLVSNINLINEKTAPALSAVVKNSSLFTIKDISVVVILYDAEHNAVSASRTYLNELKGEEVKDIDFTWPEPLPAEIVAKEIIPLYNVDLVKFK